MVSVSPTRLGQYGCRAMLSVFMWTLVQREGKGVDMNMLCLTHKCLIIKGVMVNSHTTESYMHGKLLYDSFSSSKLKTK